MFEARADIKACCLEQPYNKIEAIVRQVLSAHGYHNPLEAEEERAYTDEEIRSEYKGLILAMQGSWTSQHTYSWDVCNAKYEEDARAPVHMWRPNDDGTRRLMMRSEVLGNKTMFPLGASHWIWSTSGCSKCCKYLNSCLASPPCTDASAIAS